MENMINITPENDIIEHVDGPDCPCDPATDYAEVPTYIHNVVEVRDYLDIRVYFKRRTVDFDSEGIVQDITPVSAEPVEGTPTLEELESLGEMLFQSDFGTINVSQALLHALSGEEVVIERN